MTAFSKVRRGGLGKSCSCCNKTFDVRGKIYSVEGGTQQERDTTCWKWIQGRIQGLGHEGSSFQSPQIFFGLMPPPPKWYVWTIFLAAERVHCFLFPLSYLLPQGGGAKNFFGRRAEYFLKSPTPPPPALPTLILNTPLISESLKDYALKASIFF